MDRAWCRCLLIQCGKKMKLPLIWGDFVDYLLGMENAGEWGVAQQWIEGDEQSAAICVFTASHDDPFSHSISFSFLPSEAVAHLFFWVLFSFGCEDRLIAAATFLACNNVLLGEKRTDEEKKCSTRIFRHAP